MAMCAKVSGGCTHNNQRVSRDLHLGVCLSHCVLVCLRVPAHSCLCVFSALEHNNREGSEPGSLTD